VRGLTRQDPIVHLRKHGTEALERIKTRITSARARLLSCSGMTCARRLLIRLPTSNVRAVANACAGNECASAT